MTIRRALGALALAVAVAEPEVAAACTMCLAASTPGTQRAFALGTLFLSLLPILAIGGLALFVWRRSRTLSHPADRRPAEPPRADALADRAASRRRAKSVG